MVLTISIVYYDTVPNVFRSTLESIKAAIDYLQTQQENCRVSLIIVDNSGSFSVLSELSESICGNRGFDWEIIGSGDNIGYGAAHNITILNFGSDYHLIINPDVVVDTKSLETAIAYMEAHPDVGMLTPYSESPTGQAQNLCKRFPSVLDLFLRGFAPSFLKKLFRTRLDSYELRYDETIDDLGKAVMVSGCFMFVRHRILESIRGFAPEYFVYFEDFDLSIRIGEYAAIAHVPAVKIVHGGGFASKKGRKHVLMFIRGARIFFQRYGWKWI